MERTLVLLKPDAVERKLAGEIISRFEKRDLRIVDLKLLQVTRETAQEHYSHVSHLPIYSDMIDFIISGPVIAAVIEGERVIQMVRAMLGSTKSYESSPGTIRGDYGSHSFKNLVHASDSHESAEIEIKRFFGH